MPQKDQWDRAERLKDAVDVAAGQVRNIYITFLLVGAYIAITIGATTDEHLLLRSSVKMPVLDVALPVAGFYAIVPWLLLLLHFNLLLHFYLLACKLNALSATIDILQDKVERDELSTRLYPFPFCHLFIDTQHTRTVRYLFSPVVWCTVLLLPLLLLNWAHARFLPYNNTTITWIQRGAVVIDLILLLFFWPMILPRKTDGEELKEKHSGEERKLLWHVVLQRLKERMFPRGKRLHWLYSIVLLTIAVLVLTPFLGTLSHCPFSRHLQLRSKILVGKETPLGALAAVKEIVSVKDYKKELVQKELEKIVGLDLVDRKLRFADFQEASLIKADLKDAKLDFADLRWTTLVRANLEGAHLDDAQLKKANLLMANLRGAHLNRANLDEAILSETTLVGAELNFAKLRNVTLQRATLSFAELKSADLSKAKIQLSKMVSSQLQDANLEGVYLDGADLQTAKLQGANLRNASLRGANLENAELQGADLSNASLWGANLKNAKLQGANLSGASLWGVELSNADLRGADFRSAAVGGAIFDKETNLLLADLRRIKRGSAKRDDLRSLDDLKLLILDEKSGGSLFNQIKDKVKGAITRNDNVEIAIIDDKLKAQCKGFRSLQKCLSRKTIEQYYIENQSILLKGLKEFACTDAYIARGIALRAIKSGSEMVQRAMNTREEIESESVTPEETKLDKEFGVKLAEVLLEALVQKDSPRKDSPSEDCKGLWALPKDMEKKLRDVIERAKTE